MKKLLYELRRWFLGIKFAMSFHPEFDYGRRAALFGAVAIVAAATLAQLQEFESAGVNALDWSELSEVTRRAFLPRIHVQLWKSSPLLADMLETTT